MQQTGDPFRQEKNMAEALTVDQANKSLNPMVAEIDYSITGHPFRDVYV